MADYPGRETREVSGWAVGGTAFAGVIMLMIGVFHAILGLAAILDDEFFVVTRTTCSTSTRPGGDGST